MSRQRQKVCSRRDPLIFFRFTLLMLLLDIVKYLDIFLERRVNLGGYAFQQISKILQNSNETT